MGAMRNGMRSFGLRTLIAVLLSAMAGSALAQTEIADAAGKGNKAEIERLLKHGADVIDRIVARQVKLDRHALPVRVRMNPDAIAGHVAGENRDRIHADLLVIRAVALLEPGREPAHESIAHLG